MKHRQVCDQTDLKTNNRQDRRRSDNKISASKTEAVVEDDKSPASWLRRIAYVIISILMFYGFIIFLITNSPTFRLHLLYMHYVRIPFINASEPQQFGIMGTRNFMVKTSDNERLGAWHVLPKSLISTAKDEIDFDNSMKLGKPIIIYFHGNSGSRASAHRIEVYKKFSSFDYHVVTVDYRGYEDSSGIPSEEGLTEDGVSLWRWIKQRSGSSPIYLYGHSLGGAVTVNVAARLCDMGECPKGIIIQSSFSSLRDACYAHVLSKPLKILPFYYTRVLNVVDGEYMVKERIRGVHCPILIIHANQDAITPIAMADELYQAAKTRPASSGKVTLEKLDDAHWGHNNVHRFDRFPDMIRRFTNMAL